MAAFTGRSIGNGEGYGSGAIPTTIRGKAVEGSDDFYVQKLDRMDRDHEYERANITPALCSDEDDD